MSPLILNRRQALKAFGAVIGATIGAVTVEDVRATDTDELEVLPAVGEIVPYSTYDISGIAVLHDADFELEINAEIRLCDGVVSVTKADGSPLATTASIRAVHPAARRYVDTVAAELHRIAYRFRPITPIPKPAGKRRKRKVEPVICPSCLGHRSFDCHECEGAGVVPG